MGVPEGVGECVVRGDSGRYLYCVADRGERTSLGNIGIEGKEIYTVPYKDLSAVVHQCPDEPYRSEDGEKVKKWVTIHQEVMDIAWKRFGTILPSSFDTIIRGETDPEENITNWLKEDYDNLKRKMEKVRGKAEYGVQIFWDPRLIAKIITEKSPEIKKLDKEMESKSKGVAYIYRQKLENTLKKEIESKADEYFIDFYNRIKNHVEDLKVEKTKKSDQEKQMIINLSCLSDRHNYKKLGEELERIHEMEGISVRFTGPWPPYNFV